MVVEISCGVLGSIVSHVFRDISAHGHFFPHKTLSKHCQTSEAPSSCFGGVQIFVRCENRSDFTIYSA